MITRILESSTKQFWVRINYKIIELKNYWVIDGHKIIEFKFEKLGIQSRR